MDSLYRQAAGKSKCARPALRLAAALCLLSALGLLPGGAAARAEGGGPLTLTRFTLTAQANLGEVTFTYHITPENRAANVGLQLYVHRDDVTGKEQWDTLTPANKEGGPLILHLDRGADNTGAFSLLLPKGVYGACRAILFDSPDGKTLDFNHAVYDSAADPKSPPLALNLMVKSGAAPVKSPTLAVSGPPQVRDSGDGTAVVTIPVDVRLPAGYTATSDGFWVMAKGSGGFAQTWAALKDAQPGGDPLDPYRKIPVRLTLKSLRPGLWNVALGLFRPSFGDPLQWLSSGVDFEVGGDSWVKRAPPERIPPRLHVRAGRFVTLAGKPYDFYAGHPAAGRAVGFVRGGNYGNAITWTLTPALNSPEYFAKLRRMGCRFLRFNFNPDRYAEPVYRHAVDQVVQNIWAARMYPVLAPQDLPRGETNDQRVEKGLAVLQALATQYKGKSVWLELCNEPHEFGTWEDWKPVAARYARAVRAIDPDAFVIVPFENFSKDGRGAAKDPLPTRLVDLYDGHAYIAPGELETRFGTPIKAGLPVLIGEYGGGADYLAKMDAALQALAPAPLAASPWAFTVPGQDNLPLIADGSGPALKYTEAGQVIADDYAAWDAGRKR